jgi:pentapeptide MXKDX repeat protein
MTRSTIIVSFAAATLCFAVAFAPAAFADDMSQGGGMTKTDHMNKKDDGMKKDTMSKDSMSKDSMSKDTMKNDSMKKDDMKH